MKAIQNLTARKPFHPGNLILGNGKEVMSEPPGFHLLFRCRKNGHDFLGQIQLPSDGMTLKLEMFNKHYFTLFEEPEETILDSLEAVLLKKIAAFERVPEAYRSAAKGLLDERKKHPQPAEQAEDAPADAQEKDITAIFDRLNAEYFNGRIEATVEWGRDSKTKNRSSFRFGSYDASKKRIRLHPRLDQDFVPQCVLELTLYHEMCHQWVPPVKRNGVWQDHSPEFKKKEKEYKFYKEAKKWEKLNWVKFLAPVKEDAPEEKQEPAVPETQEA